MNNNDTYIENENDNDNDNEDDDDNDKCFPQNSEERHSHVDKSPLEPERKTSSNLGEIAEENSLGTRCSSKTPTILESNQ